MQRLPVGRMQSRSHCSVERRRVETVADMRLAWILSIVSAPALAAQQRAPIIDMHVHAYGEAPRSGQAHEADATGTG